MHRTLAVATWLSFAAGSAIAAVSAQVAVPSTIVQFVQADQTMTEGEVRKIDKEAKKITLKHGEIKNLGMPSMTMVFQVRDPSALDTVEIGEKVRFHAENVNGALVITQIQPVH